MFSVFFSLRDNKDIDVEELNRQRWRLWNYNCFWLSWCRGRRGSWVTRTDQKFDANWWRPWNTRIIFPLFSTTLRPFHGHEGQNYTVLALCSTTTHWLLDWLLPVIAVIPPESIVLLYFRYYCTALFSVHKLYCNGKGLPSWPDTRKEHQEDRNNNNNLLSMQ